MHPNGSQGRSIEATLRGKYLLSAKPTVAEFGQDCMGSNRYMRGAPLSDIEMATDMTRYETLWGKFLIKFLAF